MHRFTVSLLAFLGAALTPPQRQGHAEPQAAVKPPTRVESVGAGELPASEAAAGEKFDAKGKKRETGPGVAKKPATDEATSKKASGASAGTPKSADADGHAKKPATSTKTKVAAGTGGPPAWTRGQPGVVKLVRGSETLEVRVLDKKQHLVSATLPQLARFLRAKSGADHPIDARLVTLLATVSDHFGGREVNVVSGFRPYSPGQHARHSNHNEGRAIDFSIKGIANETVRDFCRTFRNAGVGYYPNSLFVHLDVREGHAYWVDYAAPGQAPRYRAPDGNDDDDERDAIASVDGGSSGSVPSNELPRADVARGRNNAGRAGDRDVTGERGVFVDR